MPETPIAVRLPAQCVECNQSGHVHLLTVVRGDHVALHWCCVACGAEWPVKRKEQTHA